MVKIFIHRVARTFVKECKHRSDAEDVATQENLSLLRVNDHERKHPIQHLRSFFGPKTSVQMNDRLAIAVRFVVEPVLLLHFPAVVYLPIVDQSDVRVRVQVHRLHPSESVVNLQAVKSQARVWEGGNGFYSKSIGASVRYLVAGRALYLDVLRGAEKCPDTAHIDCLLGTVRALDSVDLLGYYDCTII